MNSVSLKTIVILLERKTYNIEFQLLLLVLGQFQRNGSFLFYGTYWDNIKSVIVYRKENLPLFDICSGVTGGVITGTVCTSVVVFIC